MPGIKHRVDGVEYHDRIRAARYFAAGAWIDRTVGLALEMTARRCPTKAAFIGDDRSVTFRELNVSTDRLGAALLSLGLRPGDRALFQMGTSVDTAIALLACYKAGVIPVCAVPQYREVEIGQLAKQASPKAYFVEASAGNHDLEAFARQMIRHHPTIELLIVAGAAGHASSHEIESLIARMPLGRARAMLENVPLGSEDVLSFQLSGGTTGIPKIIPRFHAEYIGHSAAWMRSNGIGMASTLIWPLPLIHNAGQVFSLIPTACAGVTSVLMRKPDVAQMLGLIERHRVTHALSIGPIAPQLLRHPAITHNLTSLQLFATMSRADALEAHLGVPCSNLYGITEGLAIGCGANAPVEARHRTHGASGSRFDEIRLLQPESEEPVREGDAGELCFKGPSSLQSYFNAQLPRDAYLTHDGFYRSGDMMTAHFIDGRTYYAFQGRLRDNINRGGEKIGCDEVEAFVSRHPKVADAKLVPMPDALFGEKGCLFVVPRSGQIAPTVAELAEFLINCGLAKFKCPERVETIAAFPVTRIGKLDKNALKAMIADKLRDEVSVA